MKLFVIRNKHRAHQFETSGYSPPIWGPAHRARVYTEMEVEHHGMRADLADDEELIEIRMEEVKP